MNDSLIPRQTNTPESRTESLTRQFYEWEQRGRGWQVRPYPLALEPPYRPFYLFDTASEQVADDGRQTTFFSRLLESFGKSESLPTVTSQSADYRRLISDDADEPAVCDYYNEDFKEIQLILPQDLRITKPVAEQLLLSLSYCKHPLSFEIVGTNKEITAQFAASEKDFDHLKQQLKAHFPQSVLSEPHYALYNAWHDAGKQEVIADFGLSKEFMLPLNCVNSFDVDPLVAVVGALSDLQSNETGVFQILFQKARFDWTEDILDSVRFFDGTPFFVNAPEMVSLAKEKISCPLFAVCVRVAAKSPTKERTWQIVRHLGAAFSQLANPAGNELIPLSNDGYDAVYHEEALLNRLSYRCGMLLNSAELVSLIHPPSPAVQNEKFIRESERTKIAPTIAVGHPFIIGENGHQGTVRQVSLSNEQRNKHIHLIGASGSGKSTLLLNLIRQDMENNQGFCVIDPHGDLIEAVISHMPESRIKDVILFDPSDSEFPIGFNILQANSELEKTLLSSDLVATFRRMSTSWGDVMDSVLANAILAFVESERGGTLFDLKRFLVEKDFRNEFLKSVKDAGVRYFWENEFPLISGKPQSSILIRLDAFLRQKLIRHIVCQRDNKIDFRRVMDDRQILLVKLSQGLIGEENSQLLGTLLVSKLYQTAMSRQDTAHRPFFSCYLDEFHHFITPSMESVLSGVRKYNLGLVLAHQEFRQIQSRSAEVAASVLSNCYTRICFRLGDADAERFASGFSFFDAASLQNLSVGEAIGRIERAEYDFNLQIPHPAKIEPAVAERRKAAIIAESRRKYAATKAEVEAALFPAEMKSRETVIDAITDTKPAISIERKPEQVKAAKDSPKSPVEAVSEPTNEHRYLQNIIKRVGESYGFIATLEKQVFGGIGKVDVALESGQLKIACEIAATNTVEYELNNIQKCLASGFDKVVVVSIDAKHLANIRRKIEAIISSEQFAKAHFLEPENFHLLLEKLQADSTALPSDGKVKGYTINAGFKETDEAEAETRKQSVFEILKNAIRRKGKN